MAELNPTATNANDPSVGDAPGAGGGTGLENRVNVGEGNPGIVPDSKIGDTGLDGHAGKVLPEDPQSQSVSEVIPEGFKNLLKEKNNAPGFFKILSKYLSHLLDKQGMMTWSKAKNDLRLRAMNSEVKSYLKEHPNEIPSISAYMAQHIEAIPLEFINACWRNLTFEQKTEFATQVYSRAKQVLENFPSDLKENQAQNFFNNAKPILEQLKENRNRSSKVPPPEEIEQIRDQMSAVGDFVHRHGIENLSQKLVNLAKEDRAKFSEINIFKFSHPAINLDWKDLDSTQIKDLNSKLKKWQRPHDFFNRNPPNPVTQELANFAISHPKSFDVLLKLLRRNLFSPKLLSKVYEFDQEKLSEILEKLNPGNLFERNGPREPLEVDIWHQNHGCELTKEMVTFALNHPEKFKAIDAWPSNDRRPFHTHSHVTQPLLGRLVRLSLSDEDKFYALQAWQNSLPDVPLTGEVLDLVAPEQPLPPKRPNPLSIFTGHFPSQNDATANAPTLKPKQPEHPAGKHPVEGEMELNDIGNPSGTLKDLKTKLDEWTQKHPHVPLVKRAVNAAIKNSNAFEEFTQRINELESICSNVQLAWSAMDLAAREGDDFEKFKSELKKCRDGGIPLTEELVDATARFVRDDSWSRNLLRSQKNARDDYHVRELNGARSSFASLTARFPDIKDEQKKELADLIAKDPFAFKNTVQILDTWIENHQSNSQIADPVEVVKALCQWKSGHTNGHAPLTEGLENLAITDPTKFQAVTEKLNKWIANSSYYNKHDFHNGWRDGEIKLPYLNKKHPKIFEKLWQWIAANPTASQTAVSGIVDRTILLGQNITSWPFKHENKQIPSDELKNLIDEQGLSELGILSHTGSEAQQETDHL